MTHHELLLKDHKEEAQYGKFAFSLVHSRCRSTPAMSARMLSFDIITPLGSPVVPLVYIIVQISSFVLTGRSNCWFSP